MGIMSGSMTVCRYRVAGELHEGWRDLYRDRLNEFAFREPPQTTGKEEVEGWAQVHNLLDTSFDDFNKWLYGDYAIFALRVDKKRLPAKLFRATLNKRIAEWCAQREVERCPSAVRTELKEHLETEWLARTLPTVATHEACWHIGEGYLILHSLSDGVADRFRKRFFRTFGHRLVPWSPLDFLGERDLAEGLIGRAPAPVQQIAARIARVDDTTQPGGMA